MDLIVDWDGTAAIEDTLIAAMRQFGDWEAYLDASAALKRGEITLHEEIRRDAEGIKAPLEEVQRWLVERIELRPGFVEFARKHRPVIVSSNFRQLIEPILAREGLELEVRANEVEWHPDGWRGALRTPRGGVWTSSRWTPRPSRPRALCSARTSSSSRSTAGPPATTCCETSPRGWPVSGLRSRPIPTRRSSPR